MFVTNKNGTQYNIEIVSDRSMRNVAYMLHCAQFE